MPHFTRPAPSDAGGGWLTRLAARRWKTQEGKGVRENGMVASVEFNRRKIAPVGQGYWRKIAPMVQVERERNFEPTFSQGRGGQTRAEKDQKCP